MDGVSWIDVGVRARPKRTVLVLLAAAFAAMFMFLTQGAQPALAAGPQALVLSDTVTVPGPSPAASTESLEQYEAEQDGYTVTAVDGAQWDAMTAAQFKQYQVLIIGDPTCGPADGVGTFQAAVTNESTWEPVVMSSGGNKVIIGTDPTYHYTYGSGPNANILEKNGIAYAGAVSGATGAYVDLSCTYTFASNGTPVPLLDGLSSHGPGSFTVGGAPCAGSISLVSATGPTAGLTDGDLSNWSCSVHEYFTQFPSDYTPLALATDPSVPVTYTGTDVDTGGTVSGSPYILVSGGGVTVTSNLTLSPASQSLTAGTSGSVTANLATTATGINPGASVAFDVSSGPDAGKTFTGTTDSSGNTTFTYTNTGGIGTDQIIATYTSPGGVTSQGTASITWTTPTSTVCAMASTKNNTAFNNGGQPVHIENSLISTTTQPQHLVLRSLSGPPQYFALGAPGSFAASLTASHCDDNALWPLGAGDSYNTIVVTGTGYYGTAFGSSSPGYTIRIEIGDYGEGSSPANTALDSVNNFVITSPGGTVVWSGKGTLTAGSETETG